MKKTVILFIALLAAGLTFVQAQDSDIIPQGNNLTEKFDWLAAFAQSDRKYIFEISADESIEAQTFSYSGRSNITITFRGMGANRTLSLSSGNTLFTVDSGVTLVLDNNITLRGAGVSVNSGGTLIMNNGSAITGGRVYVSGGTFTKSRPNL